MNQSTEGVAYVDGSIPEVAEAATDQLVDELCHRLTALYGLLDLSLTDAGPPIEDIRERAVVLARRLHGADRETTAVSITRALWPRHPDIEVPPSWWATPLGGLISTALPARRPDRTGASSVLR